MRFNFFRDFYFIALTYNVCEIARQTSEKDLKLSKVVMKSCLFHFRIKNKSDIGGGCWWCVCSYKIVKSTNCFDIEKNT